MKHWLQIQFDAPPEIAERIADGLEQAGSLSVCLQDCADEPIYEPQSGTTQLWTTTQVTGLFSENVDLDKVLASIKAALKLSSLPNHQIIKLADQAWERVWLEDFHPMQFGKRLWVCPGNEAPPDPDAINIMLDPGLAFGTGTHATTALCLEWLDPQSMRDQLVIDYGCGSGILALAAAKLGAKHIWAVDIDDQALLATNENALRNQVNGQISAVSPESLPSIKANCLIANILAAPLIDLVDLFATLILPGGHIILSGILNEQADKITSIYANYFDDLVIKEKEEWIRITAKRKSDNV
ncbi:MAG: 50S ribosomal protein L11 methyltransferase [Gammaproteobacteria bacterium]